MSVGRASGESGIFSSTSGLCAVAYWALTMLLIGLEPMVADRARASGSFWRASILEALRDEGVKPFGREGTPESHWVLVDYGSVIVHIFTPPERDYYQLEKHWSGAKTVLRVQ